jgi:hypothetical protein
LWYVVGEGYATVGEVGEKPYGWLTVLFLAILLSAYAAGTYGWCEADTAGAKVLLTPPYCWGFGKAMGCEL